MVGPPLHSFSARRTLRALNECNGLTRTDHDDGRVVGGAAQVDEVEQPPRRLLRAVGGFAREHRLEFLERALPPIHQRNAGIGFRAIAIWIGRIQYVKR